MLQNFFNNNIDHSIASFLLVHRSDFGIKVFSFVTSFADLHSVEIIAGSVAILLLVNKKIKETILLFFTLLLTSYSTDYLKVFFHRSRPLLGVFQGLNYSFPSGHSSIAMALYGFLIYLVFNYSDNKYKKFLYLLLGLMIAAIGFSRMYLGVHYLSDVLAGYLVGFMSLVIIVIYLKPRITKKFYERKQN